MKNWILAGAACAAFLATPVPALAAAVAANPELPAPGASVGDQAVSNFYAARSGAPLWLRGGTNGNAASALIGVLQKAPLDGLPSGPAIALQAQSLMARASMGVWVDGSALPTITFIVSAIRPSSIMYSLAPPASTMM